MSNEYFPNGNPDYESFWTRERNTGWLFLATSVILATIHGIWLEYDLIIHTAFSSLGLAMGLLSLATRGRDQAEILQEREGEIDWCLEKLRNGENL